MCCGNYVVEYLQVHDGNNVSLILDDLEIFLYNTDLMVLNEKGKAVIAGRADVAVRKDCNGYYSEPMRVVVKAGYSKTKNGGWINIWLAENERLSNEELFSQAILGV